MFIYHHLHYIYMKTKAIATHKYVVDLWSAKHYKVKLTARSNIFQGMVSDIKTGKQYFFANVVGFLNALDKLYKDSEGKKSSSDWKVKEKIRKK